MNVQITSVNMRYNNGQVASVQVHFSGRVNEEDRSINVNGYVPLTAEEYQGNESVVALTDLVRRQVASRILYDPESE